MTARTRQIILLAVAVAAFAGMMTLVATGITVRRNRRDLTFGLEELDVLLADGSSDEAAAMIPWLAERAQTVPEGLRVLKRAHTLYGETGDVAPLDRAASALLEEFPANTTLQRVAVFAAVRAGRAEEAMNPASRLAEAAPAFYAWTLLSGGDVAAADVSGEPDEMLLAGLRPGSPAEDFERAWKLTGDERYALDSVLLLLGEGRQQAALDLATAAGLRHRWPLLVSGILLDRGRYDEAAELLSEPGEQEETLRLADAYLYAGLASSAMPLYQALLEAPHPPLEALMNAAWIEDDPQKARRWVERALDEYPRSWEAVRAAAVLAARDGGAPENIGLADWYGTAHEAEARLLRLRLDPEMDRRGYVGELWQLLERFPEDDVFRYAAWYFYTRGLYDELGLLLDRRAGGERSGDLPAWVSFYEGLVQAHENAWGAAAERFEASFVRSPGWQAALNAALALFRTGDQSGGEARLQDALLLARHGRGKDRIAVFLVAARQTRDASVRRKLVEEALAIDPASAEALLMTRRLEN